MDFGKHFIIIVGLSLPFVASAIDRKDEYVKAVTYAYTKILKAEVKLEDKVLKCEKKRIDALKVKQSLPNIPEDKNGKKLANAIFFLSSRNSSECTRNEESDLIFTVYLAKQLIDRAKNEGITLNSSHAIEISDKTIIASYPIIALLEVKYMDLSKSIRDQLESIKDFQHPFDDIQLLQDLKVLP